MIRVAAGIVRYHEKYLLVRRGPRMKMAGKWEFPGGKVEKGETDAECLKRELWEELRIDVAVGEHLITVTHQYPTFEIELIAYYANLEDATTLELREHDELRWLQPAEILTWNLAEADIPIAAQLVEDAGKSS